MTVSTVRYLISWPMPLGGLYATVYVCNVRTGVDIASKSSMTVNFG